MRSARIGESQRPALPLPKRQHKGYNNRRKVVGGLKRVRVVGRWKMQQLADIGLATLNMIRMCKPLPT